MNDPRLGSLILDYQEEEPPLQSAMGIHLALDFLEKQAIQSGYAELAYFIGVALLAAEECAIREVSGKNKLIHYQYLTSDGRQTSGN